MVYDKQPVEGVVRLVLDPDYSRESVSDNYEYRRYSMRSNMPLTFQPLKMPAHLAKKIRVVAVMEDNSTNVLYQSEENCRHLLFLPTGGRIQELRVYFDGAWQSEETRIYALELVQR